MMYIGVIFSVIVLSVIKGQQLTRVNISGIRYGYSSSGDYGMITFNGGQMSLDCTNCVRVEGLKIHCVRDKLVNITVSLNQGNKHYIVPFNVSCNRHNNMATVSNIMSTSDLHSIQLSWTVSDNNINNYIVYYTDDTYHRIIKTNKESYLLDNLTEKTEYQICIATISDRHDTGFYVCILQRTDFSETGPVGDVSTTSSIDSINISWKKPQYDEDKPEAYIVNYSDPRGTCGSIIINMGESNIENVHPCVNKKRVHWSGQELQILTITDLRPYTNYTITIIPINKKKTQKEITVVAVTKEGKSGPVSSITASILSGWLRIQYNQPNQPNGVVTKYRVIIVLVRLDICTEINKGVYERSDTTRNYQDVSMNILTKCGQYRIEVSPINGWTNNGGVGQMSSIIYEYSPINTLTISNIDARFISSNMARISFDHPRRSEDCSNIGFMVEVMSIRDESDCDTQIISNDNCTALHSILNKESKCNTKTTMMNTQRGSSLIVSIGRSFTPSTQYQVKIWKITDTAVIQTQSTMINTMTRNCFTDCYDNEYTGIRSHRDCVAWKDSYYRSKYPLSKNNICIISSSSKPWCATRNSYKHCNVPRCSSIHKFTGCVRNIIYDVSATGVIIKWTAPVYAESIIGYITLLHNTDNMCEKSHIQIQCDNCATESSLDEQVKNLYISCPSKSVMETTIISHQSIFDSLHHSKQYIVYIVPIITQSQVGQIMNTSFNTTLAEPDVPTNIRNDGRTTTSLSFRWNPSTVSETKGSPDYYSVILKKDDNIVNKDSPKVTNIVFINLQICTKYCLLVRAANRAGQSNMSEEMCEYTLAPNLRHVTVNNIESEPSLKRTVSWIYSERDVCAIYYRVKYGNKYEETHQYKDTNNTHVSLDNLHSNSIYTVQVQTRTNMATEDNNTDGPFSTNTEFYTGIVKPIIYGYEAYISEYRRRLNISWSYNTTQDGSIFEFIVLLFNASQSCLSRVHFICESCPSPYIWTNLNVNNKTERTKLLDCHRKKDVHFNKTQNTLNTVFNMDVPLSNYTVLIYAINLCGVHVVHGHNGTSTTNNATSSVTTVILCIILIFIISAILMVALLKIKHKPSCLYNIVMKSTTQSLQVTKQPKHVPLINDGGPIDTNPKSPKKVHKKPSDVNLPRNSTPNLKNEDLPLLEPKLKGKGLPIKEFPAYYLKMSENNNEPTIVEYKKLTTECKKMEKELGLTVNIGKSSANTKKNRFVNILPFDQTRVTLEGKNSYINANYIPFVEDESRNEYIASQGPIEHSISDFWQMIWIQNINCVVMLTRTVEENKFKCLQYWPENIGDEQTYGHREEINVTLEGESELESHIERILLVKHKNDEEARKITHLHMHTWFDHSAPNLEHFDKLLFRFHEIASSIATHPYLIHCSAGVGRTGTLICIDRIIKQLVSGCQEINIYDTVFKLRHYRNFMVQRQAQYVFIHDYIDHFLKKYMKIDDTEETLYFNEE